MSNAQRVETTEADILAFAYQHPFIDKPRTEKVVQNFGNGQLLLEGREQIEIFSFNAPGLGDVLFNVTGIKAALAKRQLVFQMVEIDLDKEYAEHCRKNGGTELEHLARLTPEDLARPGISVFWGNGYTTLIDGNNRLVRRWDMGMCTFRMAHIPLVLELEPYMARPGEEEKFFQPVELKNYKLLAKKVTISQGSK